jgi:hypothetical protein
MLLHEQYVCMYVCIPPPAVATRCSEGEKTASFTDPACAISNPCTLDRFTHPCQVTARRNVFQCIHSFIHTDSTFAYPVLHNVLYNTIYRRFFSWAFFFAFAFAFVTELLAAVFELCPLLSFLAASAFWKSSSVVLGEYSRDAKENARLRPR